MKKISPPKILTVGFLLLLGPTLFLKAGCATGRVNAPAPVEKVELVHARQEWSKDMEGLISDLRVARRSGDLLLALVPNPEAEGKSSGNRLVSLTPAGEVRWSRTLETPVKHLAISDDGLFALIVTHDDEVQGMDSTGKVLFTRDGNCMPNLVDSVRRVVCFHDDDPMPELGFEVFDWAGKDVLNYPVTKDPLMLRTSSVGGFSAMALTEGQLELFDSHQKRRWSAKVPGEIVDLDVMVPGGDATPVVAVLYGDTEAARSKRRLMLGLFDGNGKLRDRKEVPFATATQVRLNPGGEGAWVFGSTEAGQYLGFFGRNSWEVRSSKLTRYGAEPEVAKNRVGVAFDDDRFLVFGTGSSSPLAEVRLPSQEGAAIYLHDLGPEASWVAIAQDNGVLGLYRLGN